MLKLLFVDDDLDFLEFNRTYFEHCGYEVFCASNSKDAMAIFSSTKISCVILDIMLHGEDGFDFCRRLREQADLPVIFLSCLAESEIRINSFLVGGDDYMSKPYNMHELELRIKSRIQKPSSNGDEDILSFGDLVIDIRERKVSYKDKIGTFTALQFDSLVFLAKHPGQVFSYEEIYSHVWKSPIMGSRHNLQVIMAVVRQKLTDLCDNNSYIETIQRKGYRFVDIHINNIIKTALSPLD